MPFLDGDSHIYPNILGILPAFESKRCAILAKLLNAFGSLLSKQLLGSMLFGCCPRLASNKNKKFYQFCQLLELQDRNVMGIEILILENC
jgi:hypothetical protein